MIRRLIYPKQLLVLLLVLTLGLITVPKESAAISVKLNNPYSQKMNVALSTTMTTLSNGS